MNGQEWDGQQFEDAVNASNELLRAAHALNDALGGGGGATSPDDVLLAVTAMAAQLYALRNAALPVYCLTARAEKL